MAEKKDVRLGFSIIDALIQDLRYSLRFLYKNPAFTAVAILTFGLGIGANTAIFSAAEGIWLRPLAFADISRLVKLGEQTARSQTYSVAAATYHQWREHSRSFSDLSAYAELPANVSGMSVPQRVQAAQVDHGFFALMDMKPEVGRTFSRAEFQSGQKVAILSYSFWQGQFGGRGDVIGRTFQLNGDVTTVIGVMGKQVDFPPATDLWVPLSYSATEWADTKAHRLRPIVRLRDGVSRAQAAAELDLLLRNVAQNAPNDYEGVRSVVYSLRDMINGNMTPMFLRVLLGAAGFVLLIACINVGNLQLARAISLIVKSMPAETARHIAGWSNMGIDQRVLLFTIAAALVSGVLSGLVPVLRGFQFAPVDALKSVAGSPHSAPQRARAMLVVGETAVALILLVGTLLVLQGFRQMITRAAQFEPATLLTMEVELFSIKYKTPASKANFYVQALGSLHATPGVTVAATLTAPPFSNNRVVWRRFRTSTMTDIRHPPAAIVQSVSPGFFHTLHIPLFSGRDFSVSDGPNSLAVAIISEVMARRYWAGQVPVGHVLLLREGTAEIPLTIVGVSGNVEYDWTDNAPEPVIYVPFQQRPETSALLAIRSKDTSTLGPEVRAQIARLDPDLPLSNMKTLDRLMLESLAGLFQIEGLLSSFGLLALVLAAAGIYGMVSYTATLRTPEVGIRMAIGATRWDVLRLIVGQIMRLVLFGVGLGLVGAIALGRVIQGYFVGASGSDPLSFAAAFALLVFAALLASAGPARRATRVDPMVALRYE